MTETNHQEYNPAEGNQPRTFHVVLERQGVIQELRAHLRSHLVALVQQARNDDNKITKELILSQRMELKFQAINILIAEYLMRQELGTTLSALNAEISLPTMVFRFGRKFTTNQRGQTDVLQRFDRHDIWLILNTLGLCCEGQQAQSVIDAYENSSTRPPLLLCLLTSIQLYQLPNISRPEQKEDENSRCGHLESCETCRQTRRKDRDTMLRITKKYQAQKQHIERLTEETKRLESELEAAKQALDNIGRVSRIMHTAPLYTNQKYREHKVPGDYKETESYFCEDYNQGNESFSEEMIAAAKMRLRKLKIEAEVVEQSYRDFRRRHLAETNSIADETNHNTAPDVYSQTLLNRGFKTSDAHAKKSELSPKESGLLNKFESHKRVTGSLHYDTRRIVSASDTNLCCANRSMENKISQKTVSQQTEEIKHKANLLEQPLTEFRKLYRSNRQTAHTNNIHKALHLLRDKKPSQKGREEVLQKFRSISPNKFTLTGMKNQSPPRKLTEEQLTLLRSNIRKIYKDEELKSEKEEILRKAKFYFPPDEKNSTHENSDTKAYITEDCLLVDNSLSKLSLQNKALEELDEKQEESQPSVDSENTHGQVIHYTVRFVDLKRSTSSTNQVDNKEFNIDRKTLESTTITNSESVIQTNSQSVLNEIIPEITANRVLTDLVSNENEKTSKIYDEIKHTQQNTENDNESNKNVIANEITESIYNSPSIDSIPTFTEEQNNEKKGGQNLSTSLLSNIKELSAESKEQPKEKTDSQDLISLERDYVLGPASLSNVDHLKSFNGFISKNEIVESSEINGLFLETQKPSHSRDPKEKNEPHNCQKIEHLKNDNEAIQQLKSKHDLIKNSGESKENTKDLQNVDNSETLSAKDSVIKEQHDSKSIENHNEVVEILENDEEKEYSEEFAHESDESKISIMKSEDSFWSM